MVPMPSVCLNFIVLFYYTTQSSEFSRSSADILIHSKPTHLPQQTIVETCSIDNLVLITESNTSELPSLMKSVRIHSVTISANLALILWLKTILTQLF